MSMLDENLRLINTIITIYEEYLEVLLPILEEEYQREKKQIEDLVKLIKTLYAQIDKLDYKTIEDMILLASNMQQILDSLAAIHDKLSSRAFEPEHLSKSDLSATYKIQTSEKLKQLSVQHKVFFAKFTPCLIEFYDKAADRIYKMLEKNGSFTTAKIKILSEKFRANINSIHLYANVMQKILNAETSEEVRLYIESTIEEDKNMYLQSAVATTQHKAKSCVSTNISKQTFGVIPTTKSMPLDHIASCITGRPIKGKVSFKELAACVIVKYSIAPSCIEYSVASLLSDAGNTQPEEEGINAKTNERFRIISMKDKKFKYKVAYEVYGKPHATDNCVIETLDGENWRVMSTKLDSYKVDKRTAERFAAAASRSNVATRATNYNRAVQKTAASNMFAKKQISSRDVDDRAKEFPLHNIRTHLFVALETYIADRIEHEFRHAAYIKSSSEINDLLHDDRIQEIFTDTLISSYRDGLTHSKGDGEIAAYETESSFLVQIDYLRDRFMKELHDGYNRAPFADDVFAQDDKEEVIKKKLSDIIDKVMGIILSDKSNIFNSVNAKLLSITHSLL